MRRIWLTLALVLTAPAAWAQFCGGTDLRPTLSAAEQAQIARTSEETPYAEGNHWIARKGGKTLHVIGTMHLDDPRWPPVMAALGPIVAGADRLFVEMTDEAQSAMQEALTRQPEKVFITEGPTLPELLPEAEWQRLSSVMSERGLPSFMAAKMQPWMQALMLGMPTCALTNPELAKRGLDMRLMDQARGADVPVLSLESFDDLYALIASGTVEEQLDMLLAALPFADESEDHFITTAAYYFDETTAAAWEFARTISLRNLDLPRAEIEALLAEFKTKMLDTRNRAWMDTILAAPDGTSVIAVGGLHLMGEAGVLNLLAEAGYTLDRAPFRATP